MPAGVFNARKCRNSDGSKPNLSVFPTQKAPILRSKLQRNSAPGKISLGGFEFFAIHGLSCALSSAHLICVARGEHGSAEDRGRYSAHADGSISCFDVHERRIKAQPPM